MVAKNAKSRSGCSECKNRRVKCDETVPGCRQCKQKNTECPGYARRWKWSTKHEKQNGLEFTGPRSSRQRKNTSKNSNHQDATATTQQPDVVEIATRLTLSDDHADISKVSDEIPQDGSVFASPREAFDNQGSQQSTTARGQSVSASNTYLTPVTGEICPLIPDTVLCNPQIQVDFFSRQICKSLCAFDSHYNPFRIATVSRANASLLYFSLCRYLTAAFLSSATYSNVVSSYTVVRSAQTEILHRLQNEISGLDLSRQNKTEEALMAIIMYGLSTNWDGSNDPSFMHYNAAVWLFHQAYQNRTFKLSAFDNKQFFQHTLGYWWMGLCFITDSTQNALMEPPGVDKEGNVSLDLGKGERQTPHPLAGVSPGAQFLLGRVGSIVYNQRTRSSTRPFTSLSNIQKEYEALQEANNLETALLSLKIPEKGDLVDVADPDTPLEDLIYTADAYRLSALILLYHSFPELLSDRLGWRLDSRLGSLSTEEQRLQWLTALAIHTLDLLCRKSPASGTRSIEQILLVIIAGELRMPASDTAIEKVLDVAGHSDCFLDRNTIADVLSSPNRSSDDEIFNLLFRNQSFSEEVSNVEAETSSTTSLLSEPSNQECILEARSTVLRRLKSIRQILPYRSLEIVEQMVLETWTLNDNSFTSDKFWIDVMIENGWKFLLV